VYIAHYELKSDIDFFLRSERTNWREQGDFSVYNNLYSYIADKYSLSTQDELDFLAENYVRREIYPALELVDDRFREPPYAHLLK
jgi:hypothetical protein